MVLTFDFQSRMKTLYGCHFLFSAPSLAEICKCSFPFMHLSTLPLPSLCLHPHEDMVITTIESDMYPSPILLGLKDSCTACGPNSRQPQK